MDTGYIRPLGICVDKKLTFNKQRGYFFLRYSQLFLQTKNIYYITKLQDRVWALNNVEA